MKHHILIVSDDSVICSSLTRAFPWQDYDLALAKSTADAVKWATLKRYDLMILDLEVSSNNGWQVLSVLKLLKWSAPVVVITNQLGQYTTGSVADAFVEKPLDLPTLLYAVDLLLLETTDERRLRLAHPGFAPFCLERDHPLELTAVEP